MFKRRIEIHHEEAFEGLKAARQYAEEARKSKMRYYFSGESRFR